MLARIIAIFRARNLEFVRDRGTMAWNLVLPFGLILGLSFVFGGSNQAQYTVGVLETSSASNDHPFMDSRYLEFVSELDLDVATRKVARHQLDLLVEFGSPTRYWVNPDSPGGHFAEIALLQSTNGDVVRQPTPGDAVRYVDWVLPGILGMNMMFSCLFGVGYVVVRYRKNGFLKRLRATPLRAFEFIVAQIASRLTLTMTVTAFVFAVTSFLLDIRMEGSHWLLLLIAFVGSIALVSMGLLVASRVTSEELAGGLLNLVTWPMMMLSGVWFSLEAAEPWLQQAAKIFPLTHILESARAVMLDGAGLTTVAPALVALSLMSVVFLAAGSFLFRWRST